MLDYQKQTMTTNANQTGHDLRMDVVEELDQTRPGGKGGPKSVSSVLGDLNIDDGSDRGTVSETSDMETEIKKLHTAMGTTENEKGEVVSLVETTQQKTSQKPKKEQSAVQRVRKALRNAKKYLEKMAKIEESKLSKKEIDLISLNRKKVARFELELSKLTLDKVEEEKGEEKEKQDGTDTGKKLRRSNATEGTPKKDATKLPPSEQATAKKTAKRARSNEGEKTEAKRTKPSTSFDSPQEHQVAIIDRSDPDGIMTSEKWLQVESKILQAILVLPGTSSDDVSFDGAGWQKGVKVVGCSNRKSRDFLTQTIRDCGEVWQGARLEVIPITQLPLRKKIAVWIPPPVPAQENILPIIKRQNEKLNTEAWKIIPTSDKVAKGRDFVFTVDEDSLKTLTESAGSIKFGLGVLKARLPKDDKDKGENSGAAGGSD